MSIASGLGNVNAAVSLCEEKVAILSDKLSTFLSEGASTVNSMRVAEAVQKPISPIASDISTIASRLSAICDALDSLTKRIDL